MAVPHPVGMRIPRTWRTVTDSERRPAEPPGKKAGPEHFAGNPREASQRSRTQKAAWKGVTAGTVNTPVKSLSHFRGRETEDGLQATARSKGKPLEFPWVQNQEKNIEL